MATVQEVPRTLMKMYPETTVVEEKAVMFLEEYYNNGASINAVVKAHGIDYKTGKSILESIQQLPVYNDFKALIEESLRNFTSPEFVSKVYDRYEEEIKELDKEIKTLSKEYKAVCEEKGVSSNTAGVLSNRLNSQKKMKHDLMAKQLSAIISIGKKNPDEANELQDKIDKLRESAYKKSKVSGGH